MKTKLLKSKPVADSVYTQVADQILSLKNNNINPKLTVILVGDDPASHIYVKRKGAACEKLGILSETVILSAKTSEQELLSLIETLNEDPTNHGILVQLPLPEHIDEQKIIMKVNPAKDVDCFHPQNVGLLVSGQPYMLPCTPAGIVEILKYYHIPTEGKHIVVAGRSNIVGKPMVNLMLQKNKQANATVTVVHSRTKDLAEHTQMADILISALGQPHFINADFIKQDAVVVDVGMNRIDADNEKGYALVGDVHFENVLDKVSQITPVPGGVGPMTIAMLMMNTVKAAATQNNIPLQ